MHSYGVCYIDIAICTAPHIGIVVSPRGSDFSVLSSIVQHSVLSQGKMSQSTSTGTSEWNASEVLGIINPETQSFGCVGYAKTQNRRCRNPIAFHNQTTARRILAELPAAHRNNTQLRQKLVELAELALCRRYHQCQAQSVAERWFAAILAEQDRPSHRPSPSPRPTQPDSDSHASLVDEIRTLREQMEEILRNQETAERIRQAEQERNRERMRREQDRQEEERHRQQAFHREEERRREEAHRREEEEEHRQEEQRRLEEQRRQDEARRQAERERAQNEARTRRENERRERQRAETERAERAERRRQQWAESWARYDRDWSNMHEIDTSTLSEDVRDSLPWPVMDGVWQQVNETNVEQFFTHASEDIVSNRRRFLSLLRRQALRWHEDRLRRNFPALARHQQTLETARLVMQVINRMTERVRAQG